MLIRQVRSYRFFFVFILLCAVLINPIPAKATTGDIVTVGQVNGDYIGNTGSTIQKAIDFVSSRGGGTVEIDAGTYTLRNALFLKSNVSLVGVPDLTILKKDASIAKDVVIDSDHYEKVLRLNNVSGLKIGDGLLIQSSTNPNIKILRATIESIQGNKVITREKLGENYWVINNIKVQTLHPLIYGKNAENVQIKDIILDGNRSNNANVNGNYAGAVFMEESKNWQFTNVVSQNYNGDGFSIQSSENITFNNSKSINNANLGFHFGGGSNNVTLDDGLSEKNGIDGVFFCWGVTNGLVENTEIKDNGRFGVYFHRRNTDNVISNNKIINNGIAGILFNTQDNNENTSNRISVLNNLIQDNGTANKLIGIDIKAFTSDIEIHGNTFIRTKNVSSDFGIMNSTNTSNIHVSDNNFNSIIYQTYSY